MTDDVLSQMAAALNGHSITDEQGDLAGESETPVSEPAAEEPITTVEESAPPEKAAEPHEPAPKQDHEESETELAEDETGKRYVPKKRFDEVYAKLKNLERENGGSKKGPATSPPIPSVPRATTPAEKTDVIEVELLKATLPQFNPESDQYDPTLDEMGFTILQANPGMSRIEAARKARDLAGKIAKQQAGVKAEARTVKAIQSDQGITSRVVNRDAATAVDIDSMTDKELEAHLKKTGQW